MKSSIYWDITPLTEVSEEHVASIYRVEEYAIKKPEFLLPAFTYSFMELSPS
jgi:hypothetical protein